MKEEGNISGAEALNVSNFEKKILGTAEERCRLLLAGFTGQQIEALYVVLNGITVTRDRETTTPSREDKGTSPPLSLSACGEIAFRRNDGRVVIV